MPVGHGVGGGCAPWDTGAGSPNASRHAGCAAPAKAVDESRLRVQLYLHEGLDLAAAVAYWAAVTGIPASQFGKPYRATPDASIRHAKHVHGCVTVGYSCSATHRTVMGLVHALLSGAAIPG